MNPLSACRTDTNISSLVDKSSTALYRAVSLTRSVDGCRILERNNLAPIGVRHSFSSPYKLSRDFVLRRFWISSRDTTEARSIVIDPCDGSNLMRREWETKARSRAISTYFRACIVEISTDTIRLEENSKGTYRGKATCGKVVAIENHFERIDLVPECQPIKELVTCFVRPVFAISKCENGIRQVFLKNIAKFGFLGCIHKQYLVGLKDADLGDRLFVDLTIANLTENNFSCSQVDKSQAHV